MGGGFRHSSTVTSSAEAFTRTLADYKAFADAYYPAGVRWPLASRLVHSLFRVTPPTERQERPEPGPVANLGYGSPVGDPVETYPFLALLRESGLSNQRRRS